MWWLVLACAPGGAPAAPDTDEAGETGDTGTGPELTHTGVTLEPTGDTGTAPTGCGSDYAPFARSGSLRDFRAPGPACYAAAHFGAAQPSLLCSVTCDQPWVAWVLNAGLDHSCDPTVAETLPLLAQPGDAMAYLWIAVAEDAPSGGVATCTIEGSGGPWTATLRNDW